MQAPAGASGLLHIITLEQELESSCRIESGAAGPRFQRAKFAAFPPVAPSWHTKAALVPAVPLWGCADAAAMPLTDQGQHQAALELPDGLQPHEPVLVCRFTGEIFRDYE